MRQALRSLFFVGLMSICVAGYAGQRVESAPLGVPSIPADVLYKQASPAVVTIQVYDLQGKVAGSGSGFLVAADGRILTNYHVIAHCKQATVRLADGDAYDKVQVLDVDRRKDIALLKIEAVGLPYLRLARSSNVQVGDGVYSLSNPLGILKNTLSQGLISGIREGDGYRYFQISAPISLGSSGSPVLNAHGEVIGIAFALIQEGENLNFAIPIDYAKGMLASIHQAQPLSAFYEPEQPQQNEGQQNSTETGQSASPVRMTSASARPSEGMKRDSEVYLESKIGLWTSIDARSELGSPVHEREGSGSVGKIYAYPDPTVEYRQFELAFDKATKRLLYVYVYPYSMTWRQCEQLWGKDAKTKKNPDGTRFHLYRNRRLNVYADRDGNVIDFGVY